jgi:hypothetical protein
VKKNVLLLALLLAACGKSTLNPRPQFKLHHNEEQTWNEVPSRLYGKDHGLKAAWMTPLIWDKATSEPSDCDLDFYLTMSQNIPKLHEFMKYAAKSSNGFDQADCWAMLDILEDAHDVDAERDRQEQVKRVKEALR